MIRYLFLICVVTVLQFPANSQSPASSIQKKYDIPKQRLLVFSIAQFVYTSYQGEIDMDSAISLACNIYGLSHLLPYNEGYSDGSASEGSTLIDAGKIHSAKELLNTLKGTDRVQLLLQLGGYYLFRPGTDKKDLDSAYTFIQKANLLSGSLGLIKWQNESLSLLGKFYFQAGNHAESQKCFSAVEESYSKTADESGLALALENKATHLLPNDPRKVEYFQKSIGLYRKLKLKEKEIEVLSKIIAEHFRSDFNTAEKELLQLLELLKTIEYHQRQYVHYVLSFISDLKGDYITALSHATKAVESMKDSGDLVLSGFLYMRLGSVYTHLGKKETALTWYGKSLEKKSKETQLFWYTSFLLKVNLLAYMYREQEALALVQEVASEFPPVTTLDKMHLAFIKGYCYEHFKQYDLAEQNYDIFTGLAEHYPIQYISSEFPESYTRISTFHFTMGHTKKAKYYLQKALAFPATNQSISNLTSMNLMLFNMDSTDGNYISAIRHYQKYKFYSDSAFNISQRKQAEELLIKYETDKKDQNIKSLTQQAQLQQAKLQQAHFIRNMTFAGVALLMVIVGLLYNQYRVKRRTNEEINKKNLALQHLVDEKEWLLKEIHHRVKNNLQTVVSLLESQSAYLQDDALLAIQDSQNRVYAMSLIHQKLYQTENVATINMATYLPELVNYLRDSFNVSQQIHFHLQIMPLELDVSQAIPIGLIVNEAITNSIKYAFPGNSRGNEIIICLEQVVHDKTELSISDNGQGLPAGFDSDKNSGLGLKLMKGLTEDIEGQFIINKGKGTNIRVSFMANTPLNKGKEATTSKRIGQPV